MLGLKIRLMRCEISQIHTSLSTRELKRFSALHDLDKALKDRGAGRSTSSESIHAALMWLNLIERLDRQHPLADLDRTLESGSSLLIELLKHMDASSRDLISSLFIGEPWLTRLSAYRFTFSIPDESVGKLVRYGQLYRFCVKFDELQELRKAFEPERARARELRRIQRAKASRDGLDKLPTHLRHLAILTDLDI